MLQKLVMMETQQIMMAVHHHAHQNQDGHVQEQAQAVVYLFVEMEILKALNSVMIITQQMEMVVLQHAR
jgi:hypothetical protein